LLSVILKHAALSADTRGHKFPNLLPAICTLREVSLFTTNFASRSALLYTDIQWHVDQWDRNIIDLNNNNNNNNRGLI